MRITAGLESSQVLQRSVEGHAGVRVQGLCEGEGTVHASVIGGDVPIEATGQAREGRWSVELKELPAGGPYRCELSIGTESCTVDDFYVGDLWVLAGQSNMEGVGDLKNVEPPSNLVRCFGLDDRWRLAEEPLHWLFESVDSAHWPCDPDQVDLCAQVHRANRPKGAGLGLPFGVALSSAVQVPIGLVACARGGTSMQEWSPDRRREEGASLYGSMLRRVRRVGGVRGVLWYQGESDANPADVPAFASRFRTLIDSIRDDTGIPDLPFLYVQLGRFVSFGTVADCRSWNAIQEMQRTLSAEIPGASSTTAIDLELDDAIHIGTDGLRRLGRRLALLARKVAYGDDGLRTGPSLLRVGVEGESGDRIVVQYGGVNGALQGHGRVSGFSLRDHEGRRIPLIYKAEVDPARPDCIILWLAGPPPPGSHLHYGWGRDPYCNLVDSMDLAAPVFGPVTL